MLLSIPVLLIFIYYLSFSNEKALFALIAFIIVIPNSVAFVNIVGFPVISVTRICVLLFIAKVFSQYNIYKAYKVYKQSPFFLPLNILFIGATIVTFGNMFSGIIPYIGFILETLLFSFAIWIVLLNSNTGLFIKKYKFLFFTITIYGLLTYLFEFNPYIDYIESLSGDGYGFVYDYSDRPDVARSNRLQSFINHPIRAGAILCCALPIFIQQYIIEAKLTIKKLSIIAILTLIIISIILTNSRSPFIFIITFFLLYFAYLKFSKKVIYIIYGGLVLLIFSPLIMILDFGSTLITENIDSVINIFYGSNESSVGGSSLEMRLIQLAVSFSIFLESPIFGHGFGTTSRYVISGEYPELLGAESFIFKILIDYGIAGIISYTLFFTSIIIISYKKKYSSINNYQVKTYNLVIATTIAYVTFILVTGELNTLIIYIFTIALLIIRNYHKEKVRKIIIYAK